MDRYGSVREWEKDSFGGSNGGKSGSSRQTKVKDNKKYNRVDGDYDFESGLNNWTRDEGSAGQGDAESSVNVLESATGSDFPEDFEQIGRHGQHNDTDYHRISALCPADFAVGPVACNHKDEESN
ncbi:Target SNARE coiled-coily domain containing protein [Cryptosporidium felis]|nr:Target SNARE coiled-coily domain containing protein [Cryptosporidium felis]